MCALLYGETERLFISLFLLLKKKKLYLLTPVSKLKLSWTFKLQYIVVLRPLLMVFCFLISNTAADDAQDCRGLWLRCLASGLHNFLLHQCLVGKTVCVFDALTSSTFHSSSIPLLWKTWILIHLLQPELAKAIGIMYLQMVNILLLQSISIQLLLLFSCLVMSNLLQPHGLQPTRLLCP